MGSLPAQVDAPSTRSKPIETTFLIVGAGPAGAALACFLAAHGLQGIVVAAASGTAKEPRAHITNPAALECLRDLGLDEEAYQQATPPESMQHMRWGESMAGEEYARVHSWGHLPRQKGQYEAASPCRHVDLPQTLLEPILVKEATLKGWTVRFDSAFQRYERHSPASRITSTILDTLTGQQYEISSKYLLGCDGARSQVMRQLGLPLIRQPGQGLAYNILVDADLSTLVKHRNGNLHWCFHPAVEHPPWAFSSLTRMVKPWHEWIFIAMPQPGFDDLQRLPTAEEWMPHIRRWIGDDSIPVKILSVSKWNINEIVAEKYSDGNILCLGDAVHRHPPFNGLGSNTCIQDAYNLAWKLEYVERGIADKSLLETFSTERQPIGAGIVQRANQGLRDHNRVLEALGMLAETVEERKRQWAELSAATDAGRARRQRLKEATEYAIHETSGTGIEMNQRYRSSAVIIKDEPEPQAAPPTDPVLEYQISTYPGSRLPHVWLNKRHPVTPISTIDLAGHGAFCLLTGIGGEAWKSAALRCTADLGVPINVYSIGWKQDWEDVYGDWASRREVEEDGCVLARPDRTVCWRSVRVAGDCNDALSSVLKSTLGRS